MTEQQPETHEQHFEEQQEEQEQQQDSQDRISNEDDEDDYQDSVEEPAQQICVTNCKCGERIMEMLLGVMAFQALILGALLVA